MSTEKERQRYAEGIARDWMDKGKLVEGGYRALMAMMWKHLPYATAEEFEATARKLFFLGAEHVFMSMLSAMEPGGEATPIDVQRMGALHTELEAFKQELTSMHKPGAA